MLTAEHPRNARQDVHAEKAAVSLFALLPTIHDEWQQIRDKDGESVHAGRAEEDAGGIVASYVGFIRVVCEPCYRAHTGVQAAEGVLGE